MSKEIQINKRQILPGEYALERLNVARLPSGTRIHINVHVYRSKNPGPTMLILGGIHGDEINGVEIVRRTVANGMFNDLKAGNVIAIPLLNIYGFINFSREVTHGKDVNRSFPGSKNGSLASQVARVLTRRILPMVDFGLDFHTGGASRYNYPQTRYTFNDPEAENIAEAFAAPVSLKNKTISGSLRRTAQKKGIPIVVFEGGESLRFDQLSIDIALDGIRRVMEAKGMGPKAPAPDYPCKTFDGARWIRASRSGIFIWSKCSGMEVKAGEILGMIHEPHGKDHTPVYTETDGYIFGHNNVPVVTQGDALFHIAI